MACKLMVRAIIALTCLVLPLEGLICSKMETDLILAIDGSITLGYVNYDKQIDFITSILSKLPIGPTVRVGVIQFSDKWSTRVELPLSNKKTEQVVKAVKNMEYSLGYSTLTGKALELAREQLLGKRGRHGVEKVIVLMTDGKPRDENTFQYNLRLLRDKVRIISIAVGATDSAINDHKYMTRTVASGFEYSFKSIFSELYQLKQDVLRAICTARQPTEEKQSESKKCFQEKKDIVFMVDSSIAVNKTTFKKAVKMISDITKELDITPSIINVAFVQFSDPLNTRIEFGLKQYTKMYKVNQSLNNIIQSEGEHPDLANALRIVNDEIFTGDRLSADDALVLFTTNTVRNKYGAVASMKRLRDNDVHVLVVGMGEVNENQDFYKDLAIRPSDIHNLHIVQKQTILGDLVRTICRRVSCKDKEKNTKSQKCVQRKQDILFVLESSKKMGFYHTKAKKYFAKIVKKLNIAAANIRIGFMQFARRTSYLIKFGQLNFEVDIRKKIMRARTSYYRSSYLSRALKHVNDKIFNKPTGGHRDDAKDLIFIATLGNTYRRGGVQNEVRKLKKKGVRISVLDVASDLPNRAKDTVNTIHDLASGAREIHKMDFKQIWSVSQSIADVECTAKDRKFQPSCFAQKRKVLFMVDTSRGPTNEKLLNMLSLTMNITEHLYTDPKNIEVGVMLYSLSLNFYTLPVEKRSLQETLDEIKNIQLLRGWENTLGDALKYVDKEVFPEHGNNAERIIVVLSHSPVVSPEKAFRYSEALKRKDIKLMTMLIHTKKLSAKTNNEMKTLASSSSTAFSVDYNILWKYHKEIVFSMCDLNRCPEDSTRKCTPRKQDIFMVVDSSRSIGEGIYPNLVRFIRRFVNKLDISSDRTNLGLIQASDKEKTEYEMKLNQYSNLNEVLSIIDDMVYQGGGTSYIGNAIQKAINDKVFNVTAKERNDADKVLMIYTDGEFHDRVLVEQIVTNLKKHGVRVVIVGVGSETKRQKDSLGQIASTLSDVYLVDLYSNVLAIEGKINNVFYQVQKLDCVSTYEAPVQCSPEIVDLFVVLDGSSSIGHKNFKMVKAFLQKLASEFRIGGKNAHFGLLQYGMNDDTRIEFGLNTHLTNKELNNAIKNLTFLESRQTRTGLALTMVKNQIFNGKNGDRPDAPNILIIFTDGFAHDIDQAYKEATLLKNSGTRIVAIAAGRSAPSFFHQLKKLASREEDAHMTKFSKLTSVVEDLLDVVCI